MVNLLPLFADTESQYGLPAGFLKQVAQIESSGDPNARNPNSSAGGLFQFLDKTAKQYNLSNKFDPVASTDAAGRLARDNAATLRNGLGREPTAGELYLAHQQGAGGALKILQNPDASTASLVGSQASAFNGGDGTTAGQFANKWTSKFDGARPAPVQPSPQGQQPMADDGYLPPQQPGGLGGLGGMQGFGNVLQAIGASLLANNNQAPLASVGPMLMQLNAMQGKREDTALERARQAQQDAFQRQEAQRAQGNTDRGFGLQQRQYDLSRADKEADNRRADEAAKRAELTPAARYALDSGFTLGTPDYKNAITSFYKSTINKGEATIASQIEERKAAAASVGITPDSPAYKAYVATGKMPREDQAPLTATDKKAIMEADEGVLGNRAVINALDEAKKISPQAYAGVGSGARTWAGNNLPDALVPNAIASPEKAAATSNYENLVIGQALGQLKSTFGAAPTEGERKILLELQASVDKPDNVRQDILNRAQRLAETRLKFNEQRAAELRGGEYYKPDAKKGQQPAAPGAQPQQPASTAQFRQGQTATNPQTGEKLVFDGQQWVAAR